MYYIDYSLPHTIHIVAMHFVLGLINSFYLIKMTETLYPVSYNSILRAKIRKKHTYYTAKLELDRYIGSTQDRGRLWDNRNHRQMMTIGGQSVPMFHDDVTH